MPIGHLLACNQPVLLISSRLLQNRPGHEPKLDGSKEQKAEFDKVNVSIKTNTQIFEKQQQTCRSVGFTTLKVGQRVQLQSTGTVLQSYPPQIDATEIVILPLTP